MFCPNLIQLLWCTSDDGLMMVRWRFLLFPLSQYHQKQPFVLLVVGWTLVPALQRLKTVVWEAGTLLSWRDAVSLFTTTTTIRRTRCSRLSHVRSKQHWKQTTQRYPASTTTLLQSCSRTVVSSKGYIIVLLFRDWSIGSVLDNDSTTAHFHSVALLTRQGRDHFRDRNEDIIVLLHHEFWAPSSLYYLINCRQHEFFIPYPLVV